MDSSTIERVFGGVTYLFGAFTKSEFFSTLEAFLTELYGPLRFTVLRSDERRAAFRLEFSNHPDCHDFVDREPELPPSGLLDLIGASDVSRPSPGSSLPCLLLVGGLRLPVAASRPLSEGGRSRAWILFHDRVVLRDGDEEIFGLETFAFDHISFAYRRVDDQEEIHRQLEVAGARLAAINGLGELLGGLDLDVLLTKLMELLIYLASAQVGSVVLLNGGQMESRVEWGLPLEIARRLRYRDGGSILEHVLSTGQPELIRDFGDLQRYQGVDDLRVDSYLCIPLSSKRKVLGAINLVNSADTSGFSQEDRESILTVSGLAATAIENAILHRDSLEKERITANLRVARSIQERMYPKEGPLIPGYEVAWINRSCEETGGDYFDFIPVDDQNLAVVIGDVAGHGIGAALLMATGRANLRALFSLKRGIREVVSALDALLEEDMDVEKFMTLFVANIDFQRHLLTYVNAGHDHPLLFRKGDGKVETLPATGLPLGILGRASQHVPGAVSPLDAGDVLLLTTDGVWEETDTEGNRFGKERLTEVFRRWAGEPAQRIVESIHAEVSAFTRGRDQKDDFTLVAVKRVG